MLWNGVGGGWVGEGGVPANIPVMMHLIGWQPHSNQQNDRQSLSTAAHHKLSQLWDNQRLLFWVPSPPSEDRFQ